MPTASPPPRPNRLAALVGCLAALGMGLCLTLGAAASAVAEPALWKVSNGTSTAYLYGSVHLLKHEAVWDTPKVEKALGQAQELWLEIADVDDAKAAQEIVGKLGLDPAHPLSARLDDAHKARLAAVLTGMGAPPTALEPYRPWLASVTLSIAPLQKAGYDPNAGVDKLLKAAADKRGLPVKGFETMTEQMHFLSDIPPDEEIAMLNQTLDEFDTQIQELDRLETAWESGNDQEISRLMHAEMPPSLYRRLIAERNNRFAKKLAERMKTPGVIFVAVGAGHLAGPESVQAVLARSGLVATRQ